MLGASGRQYMDFKLNLTHALHFVRDFYQWKGTPFRRWRGIQQNLGYSYHHHTWWLSNFNLSCCLLSKTPSTVCFCLLFPAFLYYAYNLDACKLGPPTRDTRYESHTYKKALEKRSNILHQIGVPLLEMKIPFLFFFPSFHLFDVCVLWNNSCSLSLNLSSRPSGCLKISTLPYSCVVLETGQLLDLCLLIE